MAKRKAKKRRTTKKKVTKKDSRSMERWVFTAITVIVLFTLLFTIPSENNGLLNQEKTQNAITELVVEYTCKTNLDCFLINCKSAPDVVECVNSIATETYYENCEAYWDVDVVQDFRECACVAGVCK